MPVFIRTRQEPRMFKELDFTKELPLVLHDGTIKFDAHDGKGEQVQYGGRTPSEERVHLDQIEKDALREALKKKGLPPNTTDYPRHSSEPETAKLLADIIADDIQLWDPVAEKVNPAVSKGFPGASDIHIASMPGADTRVYNNITFACLEEGISFGIVYEKNWEQLWFYVWKSRQIKADPEIADNDGQSPLWTAAAKGNTECLGLLIQAKANVDKATNEGVTPVSAAACTSSADCLKLLLHAKANVDKAATDGCTPIFIAAQFDNADCLKLLLCAKANVDKARNDGSTPVYIAAEENNADCLELLLHAKADFNKTYKWLSPLMTARLNGNTACVDLLRRAKAEAGQTDCVLS